MKQRELVLLGGGHAHVHVLADLARRPISGWQVSLITPHHRQIYSGMLPGWIAGHYRLEDCAIDLGALAERAGVTLQQTAAASLDADTRRVHCTDGTDARFDRLSIDTGSVAALDDLSGSRDHTLPIRPIEAFVAAWPALVDRIIGRCARFDLIIIGAGAAGLEVAFAIRQRAWRDGWSHLRVSLLGSEALPLDGMPMVVRRSAVTLLRQRGIRWLGESRVAQVRSDHVVLEGGSNIPADATLLVTGAAAPSWPRLSGLSTDGRGFIRVVPSLQSESHPLISAAGDVAVYTCARPKSGVYAVRAGPVLARNLRALCEGRDTFDWVPQRHALYLISTGQRSAIASWGNFAASGGWAWRWKDRIDRRFVQRFTLKDSS